MTQIRTAVIKHLAKAAFPMVNRAQVENILVMAICHYRLFLKRTKNNTAPLPGRMRPGKGAVLFLVRLRNKR